MAQVTFIIPTKNEEEAIPKVLDELRLSNLRDYVVIVADGLSTDRTREISQSRGCTVLLVEEKGKGAAIREALKIVESEFVITLNGDFTYPAYQSLDIYLKLLEGYDVVLGCRQSRDRGAIRPLNLMGNWGLNVLALVLFGKWYTDFNSGMWGFKTSTLRKFNLTGEFFTVESDYLVNSVRLGCKVGKVCIHYRKRESGVSKLKVLDGFKIAWFLIRQRVTR